MIKANELRIGNFFILPNGKICKISYHEIRLMVVALEKPDYQPIPLTEEWLLKFGFDKMNDEYYYLNGYYASFDADSPMWFGQQGCCQHETIKDNIKHVHQLQNLYFALTGEELTISNK